MATTATTFPTRSEYGKVSFFASASICLANQFLVSFVSSKVISSLANVYPLISRIQLIILIIARAILKTMNKNYLSFQICETPDEFESAKDSYEAVLVGLWRNIIKNSVVQNLEELCSIHTKQREQSCRWYNKSYLWWLGVFLGLERFPNRASLDACCAFYITI